MQARYIFAGIVAPALLDRLLRPQHRARRRAPPRLRRQHHGPLRRLALRQAGLRNADGRCRAEAAILQGSGEEGVSGQQLCRLDLRLAQRQRRDQRAAALGSAVLHLRSSRADHLRAARLAAIASRAGFVLGARLRAVGRTAALPVERRARLCRQPLPLASLRVGRSALAARRAGAPLAAIPGGRVAL